MTSNKAATAGICLAIAIFVGVLWYHETHRVPKAAPPVVTLRPIPATNPVGDVIQLPKDTYFIDFKVSGAYGQYLNVITIKLNSIVHDGDIRVASGAEFTFRDSNGKPLLTVRNP